MTYGASYERRRAWGEALRRRRLAKHYDQFVLAMKAEISRNTVSQYERAGVVPSVCVAYRIAKVLDWTVEEWAKDAEAIENDGSWYNRRFDHDITGLPR